MAFLITSIVYMTGRQIILKFLVIALTTATGQLHAKTAYSAEKLRTPNMVQSHAEQSQLRILCNYTTLLAHSRCRSLRGRSRGAGRRASHPLAA